MSLNTHSSQRRLGFTYLGLAIVLAITAGSVFAAQPGTAPQAHNQSAIVALEEWIDKITPGLLEQAAKNDGPLDCIITLREPQTVKDRVSATMAQPTSHAWIADTTLRLHQEYAPAGVVVTQRYSHLNVVRMTIPANMLVSLAEDSRIAGISPNRKVQMMRTQGKKLIHVPEVHTLGYKGAGVGIAILDTGVDYTHSELSPAGAKTIKLFDAVDSANGTMDQQGHGTSVAGIAAGSGNGVAPEATVVSVRVLNKKGEGTSAQILDGINAVIASIEAGNPHNIKVANLSLGGYDNWAPKSGSCDNTSRDFTTAFQKLVDAGVLIVVAAGNGGCTKGVSWPACISHAMAIGAVYDDDLGMQNFSDLHCNSFGCFDFSAEVDDVTCYSDSGDKLSVWAPSHCAKTPTKGGGYEDCFGGTSAATPYVAGAAALLTQAIPGRSVADLRKAFEDTGRRRKDSRNDITRSRIDTQQALTKLKTGCPTPPTPSDLAAAKNTFCGSETVTMTWGVVAGATSYTLEVSDNPSFEQATEISTNNASYAYSTARTTQATLYFRVKTNGSCGLSSDFSSAIQIAYDPNCGGPAFAQTYFVSGIAHTPGVAPAYWLSDLAILNTNATTAEMRLNFFSTKNSLSYTTTLPAGQQATWVDVLDRLFAVGGNDTGVIVVESSLPVFAFARTYSLVNVNDKMQSYGQSYEGLDETHALGSGKVGYLPNLRSDGSFRTNPEFVNVGTATATVEVRFFENDRTPIGGPLTFTIPPRRRVAQTAALPAGHAAAFAEVRLTSPTDGKVIGFASVVDGDSTDPTTIPLVIR